MIASDLDERCVQEAEARQNYTNGVLDPEAEALLKGIQQSVCPNQCSGRGACEDGKCQCNEGMACVGLYIVLLKNDLVQHIFTLKSCKLTLAISIHNIVWQYNYIYSNVLMQCLLKYQ